ncbi:MAG: hypothetical protein RIQ41_459 [Candidatus Parcubacteria bacterium]|jgi:hypothetical protein
MAAVFYRWARTNLEEAILLTFLGLTTLFTGGVWLWVGSENLSVVSRMLFGAVWMAFIAVAFHSLIQGRLLWPLLKWAAWGVIFRIPRFILFGGWWSYLVWFIICLLLFATTQNSDLRSAAWWGGVLLLLLKLYLDTKKAAR